MLLDQGLGLACPPALKVILSTPEPMAASAPLTRTWFAAMAIDCSPEEQKRLTVVPGVVTGIPAITAAMRATFEARGTLRIGAAGDHVLDLGGVELWGLGKHILSTWASRSSGRVILKDPRKDLAKGVRELATTTASLIGVTPFLPYIER